MSGFDRVAYRIQYDKMYFKKTIVCPSCGDTQNKVQLKRHLKTKKCLRKTKQKLWCPNLVSEFEPKSVQMLKFINDLSQKE